MANFAAISNEAQANCEAAFFRSVWPEDCTVEIWQTREIRFRHFHNTATSISEV